MAVSESDLDSFNEFARTKLKNGGAESMAELFDLWLLEHPSELEQADTAEALKEGLADVDAGHLHDFDEVNADIRNRHGWSTE